MAVTTQIRRVVEDGAHPWARDVNSLLDVVLGNLGGQLALVDFSGAQREIQGGQVLSTGNAPLYIRSGNSSAAQIRNSGDTVNLLFASDDGIYSSVGVNAGTGVTGANAGEILVGPDNTHRAVLTATGSVAAVGSKDNLPLQLRINNVGKIEVSTAGHFSPLTHNAQDIGLTGTRWRDLFVGRNADIDGTADIAGATTLGATLGVTGATTLSSTLSVGGQLTSLVTTASTLPPFVVGSTVRVVNLNADLLDDKNTSVTGAANSIPRTDAGVALDPSWIPATLGTGQTLAGGLLFTPHNTYDIGAAGSSSPRTVYVGTSLLVGTQATLGPTSLVVGDTALSTKMGSGLTLNQGSNSNEILALQSSSVAHGMTTLADTDTYFSIAKVSSGGGGAYVRGFSSSAVGILIEANQATPDTGTMTGTANYGALDIRCWTASTNTHAQPASGAKLVTFRTGDLTRFAFREDGASFEHLAAGTWATFDAHDDIAILNTVARELAAPGDEIATEFSRFLAEGREWLQEHDLVSFGDDGAFVNRSRMQELLVGAVRQCGAHIERLESRLRALESPRG